MQDLVARFFLKIYMPNPAQLLGVQFDNLANEPRKRLLVATYRVCNFTTELNWTCFCQNRNVKIGNEPFDLLIEMKGTLPNFSWEKGRVEELQEKNPEKPRKKINREENNQMIQWIRQHDPFQSVWVFPPVAAVIV